MSRKLIYYVASTIDGYIAHEDGSIDGFIGDGQSTADYLADLQDFDTVLMGKHTYEFGYQYGIQPGQSVPTYAHMMQYVFSRTATFTAQEGLELVKTDAVAFVRDLKAQEGGSIYLSGGGQLAGNLLQAGLIDEVKLKINPIAFGCGIPLFGGVAVNAKLTQQFIKHYDNGVITVSYTVDN